MTTTDQPNTELHRLRDFLVRMAEGQDNAPYRYMEFKMETPPIRLDGCWWLDITLGESRDKSEHWVIQWWRGLQGFGVSRLTEGDPSFTPHPDEVIPDFDAVSRRLGITK